MVQYQRIFIMIGEKMMFVNQNADAYDRETEEYIVAYLDLLGVTNRIKDYSQDELSMNKLHNLYTFSIRLKKIRILGLKFSQIILLLQKRFQVI